MGQGLRVGAKRPIQRPFAPVVAVEQIDATTDWHHALHGARVVVHLAARVHVMHDTASDPLDCFSRRQC